MERLPETLATAAATRQGAIPPSATNRSASSGTTRRTRRVEGGVPVFVKQPSRWLPIRALAELAGLTRAEVRFYQQLSHEVPVRVPRFVRGEHSGRGFLLVLEDLCATHCTLPRPGDSLSPEQLAVMLRTLASLHGQYWNTPRFDRELRWLRAIPAREARLAALGRPLLELGLARSKPALSSQLGKKLRRYVDHRDRPRRILEAGPHTLIHHDCHPGNLFFTADGEAGLLDWQLVRCGSYASDVSYLLATALEPPVRRSCENDLLTCYLDALPDALRPSLERARECIRLHSIYPLEAMVLTRGLGPLMAQQDLERLIERTACAASDADVFHRFG